MTLQTTSTQQQSETPQQRYYRKNKAKVIARSTAWRKENPAQYSASKKKWKANNPELVREQTRRDHIRKYGIEPEDKDALLASQGGACAICRTDTPTSKGWHIDHCHATAQVRGILCHHCNSLLGNARDNPETLAAAITYLGKFNNGRQEAQASG